MRVRGLKHGFKVHLFACLAVAPHAGAWIETCSMLFRLLYLPVAPHAGAWIETCESLCSSLSASASHPMRVRGLKLC